MKYLLFLLLATTADARRKKEADPSALDDYLASARASPPSAEASAGSAYTPGSRYAELGRDFRANAPGDLITILVSDRANAVSRGNTTAGRSGEAKGGVNAALGPLKTNRLTDLLDLSGGTKLEAQGETGRSNVLTTTLSARITEVLPNGNLVIEGRKAVTVNSESQTVEVRGVVRWNDVSAFNQIRSDRIAQLDIKLNGKGVVGDAVRRPNILYRLLMGILPF